MLQLFTIFFILFPSLMWAKGPSTEIRVSLLGQPCLLQGPLSEGILKTIHSMGPAQIYPNLNPPDQPEAMDQANKALEKIRSSAGTPNLLDRYREKLIRRLQAQIEFLAALKKPSSSDALQKVGKNYLKDLELRKFETLAKKLVSQKKETSLHHELVEQLFDIYNDSIEADPEAEFHRAIKKLNIQYNCSFEENSEEPHP